MNSQTGQVMEVAGGGANDGGLIRSAADSGGANQMWNIVRTRNGYLDLFNANSGRTAEVASGSLNNGASVRQWGTADNSSQQWYFDEAGGGNFYLRNANSNKYLTSDPVNSTQSDLTGSGLQKWRFVLANPTDGPVSVYPLHGNVMDEVGANHGVANGSPAYDPGPDGAPAGNPLGWGQRLRQSPSLIDKLCGYDDLRSVRWDGGGAWQRLFDFGADTSSYMFLTPRSGDNTLRFAVTTEGNGAEQILETAPLPVGEWVHLTLTLGGNTGILYVNGLPQCSRSDSARPERPRSDKELFRQKPFRHGPAIQGVGLGLSTLRLRLEPAASVGAGPTRRLQRRRRRRCRRLHRMA